MEARHTLAGHELLCKVLGPIRTHTTLGRRHFLGRRYKESVPITGPLSRYLINTPRSPNTGLVYRLLLLALYSELEPRSNTYKREKRVEASIPAESEDLSYR